MFEPNQNLPTFAPEIYTRIAMNDLVVYAVYYLSQSGKEINTEDIVATCFLLFPKRFQLRTYLDEHGNGSGTAQGQVLFAELITEAVCSEIARRGVVSGKYLMIEGAQADAIRREQINLQNKYAHKIHEHFVDAQHRGIFDVPAARKGRPPKKEQLADAIIA